MMNRLTLLATTAIVTVGLGIGAANAVIEN